MKPSLSLRLKLGPFSVLILKKLGLAGFSEAFSFPTLGIRTLFCSHLEKNIRIRILLGTLGIPRDYANNPWGFPGILVRTPRDSKGKP